MDLDLRAFYLHPVPISHIVTLSSNNAVSKVKMCNLIIQT